MFDATGNASGHGGCNTFNGSYTVDGATITLRPDHLDQDGLRGRGGAGRNPLISMPSRWRRVGRSGATGTSRSRVTCPWSSPPPDRPGAVPMRLAHVRERNAPPARAGGSPRRSMQGARWLDLEPARRRAVRARPTLEHDQVLYRQPLTTLDAHLGRGLRVEALRDLVDGFVARDADDDAVLDGAALRSARRSSARRPSARLRLRGPCRHDVVATRR